MKSLFAFRFYLILHLGIECNTFKLSLIIVKNSFLYYHELNIKQFWNSFIEQAFHGDQKFRKLKKTEIFFKNKKKIQKLNIFFKIRF